MRAIGRWRKAVWWQDDEQGKVQRPEGAQASEENAGYFPFTMVQKSATTPRML